MYFLPYEPYIFFRRKFDLHFAVNPRYKHLWSDHRVTFTIYAEAKRRGLILDDFYPCGDKIYVLEVGGYNLSG